MGAVWEGSRHSGSELLMLLAFADFSDDQGNSYPAVRTVAAKCRMQTRNANYVLKALQNSGELQVRPNEGPKGTNRYRIVLEALKGVQSSAGGGLQSVAGVQSSAGLQPVARTPATQCPKPLQRSADEPSLNRQEPERGRAKRSPAAERASRLSSDWVLPTEWKDWADNERADLDPIKTAARFRDFWVAKPGREGSKLDWFATWRNWVRNERALPGNSAGRRNPLHADGLILSEGV